MRQFQNCSNVFVKETTDYTDFSWSGRWPQPNNHHAIFSSLALSSHVKPRDGGAIAHFYWGEDVRRET